MQSRTCSCNKLIDDLQATAQALGAAGVPATLVAQVCCCCCCQSHAQHWMVCLLEERSQPGLLTLQAFAQVCSALDRANSQPNCSCHW